MIVCIDTNTVVQALADGQVHVLFFGTWVENWLGQVRGLTRWLMQRFPDGVAVTLATNTHGAIGPDLVPPEEEAAWDRTLYETIGQVQGTVALWAGTKQAAKYGGVIPEDSPVYDPYLDPIRFQAVVVDGHGVIRARIRPDGPMETHKWRFEERLDEIVKFLVEESPSDTGGRLRPVEALPTGMTRVP